MKLPLTVKHESVKHAVIYDADKNWIATVNTIGDTGRAERVRKAIELPSAAQGESPGCGGLNATAEGNQS